ncbi:regulatory protein MarR [[Leptolyngbya] sp. PCC 7376]|uniref:MarR family winged helix-turn-helix transcriptional regulator n=1 Tax=[Leptolyngbya] sp. PCC 7376 TaxID=111781 RepID=UPI00029ED808|nr:MarR family winged helix-turn-helix transcriptional regulator [[Leptolyngbya] sp. PCC 7376]AFY38368.1 regulatory protein MarR [[Leptolyngbya] sp. PCC 7376]
MRKKDNPQEAIQFAQVIASDCIGARVRILSRAISRIYDDRIRPHGIKFSQMNILTVVTLHEPIQQVEVGRMLSLEKSTLSRNVNLMKSKGWLQSQSDEGSNRFLVATQKGHELLVKAAPDWVKAQEQVTAILGEQTAIELRQAADQLQPKDAGD